MKASLIGAWILWWSLWLHSLVSEAQAYFNRRYPYAPDACGATNVLPLPNGYAVFGYGNRAGGDAGIYVQILASTGQPLRVPYQEGRPGWVIGTGRPGSLQAAHGGGFMAVGYRAVPNNIGTAVGQMWRFSAQGDTLWRRTYQASPGDGLTIQTVSQLPNGDYVLGGQYYRPTGFPQSANADMLLLVTDSSGHERWRQTYAVQFQDLVSHILATPDGGFLLSGDSEAQGSLQSAAVVVKVDSVGRQQWVQTFDTPFNDFAVGALPRPGGGYVVAATTGQPGWWVWGLRQPMLVWLDSAGRVERQRAYGPAYPGTGPSSFYAVPGGYVLGGLVCDTTGLPAGMVIITQSFGLKVCEDGDSIWYRTYRHYPGRLSINYLYDFRPTPDGGFVGGGLTLPNPPDTAGIQAMWVFKTDQYGYLQPGGAPPTVQCAPNGLPGELIMNNEPLSLWPNPSADGVFYLTPPPAPSPVGRGSLRLTVTDALGRVVWHGTWDGAAETVVDLSVSSPGLYVLRVQDASGRQRTFKLMRE